MRFQGTWRPRASAGLLVTATIAGVGLLGSQAIAAALRQAASRPTGASVVFPSAGVRLTRPAGFEMAQNFDGFQQEKTKSAIVILRVPGPFGQVTRAFDAAQIKAQGMELKSRQSIKIDGQPGLLLNVTQTAGGTTFGKWIAAFGNASETVLMTASFPQTQAATVSARLKAVLLSARRDNKTTATAASPGAPVVDPGPNFAVTASPKLKLTRTMGKMTLYTGDGVIPAKSVEDPFFLVAPSVSSVKIPDKRAFALARLQKTAKVADVTISSHEPIQVNGLSGFESIAEARDADSDVPLTLYQVLLYEGDSYILMQGVVGAKQSTTYVPEFKTMAHSLKLAARK